MFELKINDKKAIINRKKYHCFLEACFKAADTFSMNYTPWTNAVEKELEEKLRPFLIRKISTPVWFGYDYRNAPEGDYREIDVNLYRTDEEACQILKEMFDDIFFRKRKFFQIMDSLQNLEDICFFRDKKLTAGTVTHELLLGVQDSDIKLLRAESLFTKWDKVYSSEFCRNDYDGFINNQ